MKFCSRKLVFSAFVLAARDAASRFRFGHGSAAPGRGSWHPLILRWRRRRRQEKLVTGRTSKSTSILSFPQFHFHYATHLTNQSQRSRALSSFPATSGPNTGIVMDHRWTTIRTAALTRPPRYSSNPSRGSYAYHDSQLKRGSVQAPAPGRAHPPETRPIMPLVAHRPLGLQFGSATKVGRTKTRTDELLQRLQSRSQPQHWLQIFRVRQQGLDYRRSHRPPERRSQRVALNEPEELLWRRANRPVTEDPKDESHRVASDNFEPVAARTFQRQEAVDQSSVSERGATLQITRIDPGLLDRLTDDVIRRVEQRARIERQRRGL